MSLTLGPRTLKVPQTLTLSLALSTTSTVKVPSVWSFLNSAAVTSPWSSCWPRNAGVSLVDDSVAW
jgi:hypothetical protein